MAPPVGRQNSIISIELYAKLRHAPPPLCNLGRRFEHTNGERRPFFRPSPNFRPKTGLYLSEDLFFLVFTGFWPKTGLNLSEDPSFFWSSPNFGQENGLILGGKFFILVFIVLKFSEFPAPPFENPAYATDYTTN